MATTEAVRIEPTQFQQDVLVIPETYDVFEGGGRGGGKSVCLALLALRHGEQHGANARILYVRRTYKSLADFELLTRELFTQVYGGDARYNGTEHVWRLPGGAYMELAQLDGPQDYSKFQGRSFSLLLIDEAGEWPSSADLDKLRSNLRGPKGVPIRTVMAGNPGGPGHGWLSKRYVFRAAPWEPFEDESTGRQWIYAPSTYLDNDRMDQDQYAAQLKAACPTDDELLKAWLQGDWSVARGAFFSSVINESRNAVDPWQRLPDEAGGPAGRGYRQAWSTRSGWLFFLAYDHGSSAPAVCYLCAESPGAEGPDGKYYPPRSIILIDELAFADPDNPNLGLGYTVPRIADEICDMCRRWDVPPTGVADDAIFSQHGSESGTIASEFSRAGVSFTRAQKGSRIHGWEMMRRLLADAGEVDQPGLYISRACSYWWETVPYLGRDPRRMEDVDTRGADHGADATRYSLTWSPPVVGYTGIRSAC